MLVLHPCYAHAGLESLGSTSFRPVHVVNLEIKDNHEDATLGAFLILKLCNMVRIHTTFNVVAFWSKVCSQIQKIVKSHRMLKCAD